MRLALVLVLIAACSADDEPPDTRDIALRLADLPGVTVSVGPPDQATPGYRYFVLQVTQPVDHDDPGGATFQHEVSLIHLDVAAPMIAFTTGYDDYARGAASEPAQLLVANQISIAHRLFGTSRPATPDWSTLTIEQMAADEHHIIALLKPIYDAAWISSGGSKGGMTATYHRRFYPDDVDGTVAYVAPLSFSIPDARYAAYLASLGDPACAAAVRAVAKEMLQNRRAALLTRAQSQAAIDGFSYTRIPIGPALESAILDLEWSYWQYSGARVCGSVPPTTASDDTLFQFLDFISPVSFSDDRETAAYEAYFYQAYAQLGSPGTVSIRGDLVAADLAPLRQYSEADFAGTLPLGVPIPTHDPSAMADIDDWIQHDADRMIFVYGQWDPWSGGMYRLGGAADSLELTVPAGTHDSSLLDLPPGDLDLALTKLEAWTGVTPRVQQATRRSMLRPRTNALR
ncbi:S28 family serine protease [soil metagenome]